VVTRDRFPPPFPPADLRVVPFGVGVLAVDPLVRRLDRRVSGHGQRHGHHGLGSGPRPSTTDRPSGSLGGGSEGGWRIGPGKRWGVVESGRLEVAMAAYLLGYFLLDTVGIPVGHSPDGPGWSRVRRLATVAEAQALIVHGPVDRAVSELLAAELRMVVHVARDVVQQPGSGSSRVRVGAWGAAPHPHAPPTA
jgi:hypothetical protein